jgi:hypothetical protein
MNLNAGFDGLKVGESPVLFSSTTCHICQYKRNPKLNLPYLDKYGKFNLGFVFYIFLAMHLDPIVS